MFFEYALDPAVISNWDRARYFLDAFGPWKGRFLAKLPKTWARAVLDGLTCGDVERKRIEERLVRFQTARPFTNRVVAEYPKTNSWVECAKAEHTKNPFRAIISRPGVHQRPVIDAEIVDESEPLWRVEQGQLVSRTPSAIGEALNHLLAVSRRLVFIDPYFRANHSTKCDVVTECCRLLPSQSQVEIHAALGGDRDPSYEQAKADAAMQLARYIPTGLTAKVSFWLSRPGGQRLHNRYLITDVGGVQFGDGIEKGSTGQVDRLSILDDPSREQLLKDFSELSAPFDRAGPEIAVKGTGRR